MEQAQSLAQKPEGLPRPEIQSTLNLVFCSRQAVLVYGEHVTLDLMA